MVAMIDETGNRYGHLTVIQRITPVNNYTGARWLCRCDCGNLTQANGAILRRGVKTRCRRSCEVD